MDLPGRLRCTTLGDLLGTLHRAAATGTLELVDERGRAHRVYVSRGLVAAVEVDGATASLGEVLRRENAADDEVLRHSLLRAIASRRLHGDVLVGDFQVAPSVVGRALRQQILGRLMVLERLDDARVTFRVAVRAPRGALGGAGHGAATAPLGPGEFLHGRRRARDRAGHAPPARGRDEAPWRVLGLEPGAGPDEVRRAYRRLARSLHPDLHPAASDEERRSLEVRFAQVTDAYRALVA